MFRKAIVLILLSLFNCNIFGASDAKKTTYIPPVLRQYIGVLADMYRNLELDYDQELQMSEMGILFEESQKPEFSIILELLTFYVDLLEDKQELTDKDWKQFFDMLNQKTYNLSQLISFIHIIDVLNIYDLEKPILVQILHKFIEMLQDSIKMLQHNKYKEAFALISHLNVKYREELKFLLYDFYPLHIWLVLNKEFTNNRIKINNIDYSVLCTSDRQRVVLYNQNIIKVLKIRDNEEFSINSDQDRFEKILINNNYIIALTDKANIKVWDIEFGTLMGEVGAEIATEIVFLNQNMFGYRTNIGKIYLYKFTNLNDIAYETSEIGYGIHELDNNRIISLTDLNANNIGTFKIYSSDLVLDTISVNFVSIQNGSSLSYENYKKLIPCLNPRGFLMSLANSCFIPRFISDSIVLNNDSGILNAHLTNNASEYVIHNDNLSHTAFIKMHITDQLNMNFSIPLEHRIIYYLHQNSFQDVLNKIYPEKKEEKSSCSIM